MIHCRVVVLGRPGDVNMRLSRLPKICPGAGCRDLEAVIRLCTSWLLIERMCLGRSSKEQQ